MLYRISSSLYLSSKYIFYATEHTAIHSRIIAKSNIYLQCTPCLLAKGYARDRACSKGILCDSIYAVLSAPKPLLVREKSSAGMVQCFRTWVRVLHWKRSFCCPGLLFNHSRPKILAHLIYLKINENRLKPSDQTVTKIKAQASSILADRFLWQECERFKCTFQGC